MIEVSLALSVRQWHNEQNHLFSDSKISGFKNWERKELILGENGIATKSNVSSSAEKQKHWLHETLILKAIKVTVCHWNTL